MSLNLKTGNEENPKNVSHHQQSSLWPRGSSTGCSRREDGARIPPSWRIRFPKVGFRNEKPGNGEGARKPNQPTRPTQLNPTNQPGQPLNQPTSTNQCNQPTQPTQLNQSVDSTNQPTQPPTQPTQLTQPSDQLTNQLNSTTSSTNPTPKPQPEGNGFARQKSTKRKNFVPWRHTRKQKRKSSKTRPRRARIEHYLRQGQGLKQV